MQMQKSFLDKYEKITLERLRNECEAWGVSVFPKVRAADIPQIAALIENDRIPDDLIRFALQSHFDFSIVNNESNALFAIEFDGYSHKSARQKQRDEKKNHLCERSNFPLLRINSNYFQRFGQLDVLAWFVHAWFSKDMFDRAQEKGYIPEAEIFFPSLVTKIPGQKRLFPLSIMQDAINGFHRLFKEGRLYKPSPSYVTGVDKNGTFHSLAAAFLNSEEGLFIETGMRNQLFPIVITEVIEEIAIVELFESVQRFFARGRIKTTPSWLINKMLNEEFPKKYEVYSAGG